MTLYIAALFVAPLPVIPSVPSAPNGALAFPYSLGRGWAKTPANEPRISKPGKVNSVELYFVNPANVEWRIRSTAVVQNVLYYFGLFNLDRPELNMRTLDSGEVGYEPLRITVRKADFVNPDEPIGGLLLPLDMVSMIRPGERIFGFATVNCPGCKMLAYWLYFKQGEFGWFSAMQQSAHSLSIPVGGIVNRPEITIDGLVPQGARIPIQNER
jgi:hypothetical protein